ncbi:MAG: GTPase ObgE, partial [Ignavibacteria bacterium]|nr:GTPase ObgE [Ignavibacteria bacterium]
AEDGGKGLNKKMHGAAGNDFIVKVPIGTIIKDIKHDLILADLIEVGQQAIIASGGRGGRGNWHFATSRNPAPDFAEKGEMGEDKEVEVELKLLADVGLVGFPSVGKSTFLSVVSKAKPEIAAYPFTTLIPQLGVVQVPDGRSFVLADLPGLIAGAHQGKGLGHQFLKHIERCRVLVHIIDMGAEDHRDPIEDFRVINEELAEYEYRLTERPQVLVANKMDLPEAKENLARFKEAYPNLPIYETITLIREGLDQVLYAVADILETASTFIQDEVQNEAVHYKFIEEIPFEVRRIKDNTYELFGDRIQRIFHRADITTEQGAHRFSRQLRHLGVDQALRAKGVKNGDIIVIEDYQFIFMD